MVFLIDSELLVKVCVGGVKIYVLRVVDGLIGYDFVGWYLKRLSVWCVVSEIWYRV